MEFSNQGSHARDPHETFLRLWMQYEPFVRSCCPSAQEVNDVMQEVSVAALRKFSTLDDLLFGDVGGNFTSGLLLVGRKGHTYEETFWGQPKWPLFLTEAPSVAETAEFKRLVNHLEQKTMGSFSVAEDAIWKTQN